MALEIRLARPEDLPKLLTLLNEFRDTSQLKPQLAAQILHGLSTDSNVRLCVAELAGKIVGASTLLIEQKFIHNGGKVGRIEDVVVGASSKGQGVGAAMVEQLILSAKSVGCYKVLLTCSLELADYYGKFGFQQSEEVLMRLDIQ